jgi:hypothetical protein
MPAVIAAAVLLALTCHPSGPVDWKSTDEATIQKNLEALGSAGDVYARELSSGDTAAAALKVQAALLASAGVDTACIAPDYSVWALFDNGILAGTGTPPDSAVDLTAGRSPAAGKVRVSGNWEVLPQVTIVTPFSGELPNTRDFSVWLQGLFRDFMWWGQPRTCTDSAVTRDSARNLLASGPGLLYWSGHGTLVRVPGYSDSVSGLELGTLYDKRAMAQAAAGSLLDDLLPTGRDKRCALWLHWLDQSRWKYAVVVLPAFVRKYADFDGSATTGSPWKSMVYLSACLSAYGNPSDLVQAFLDKGADVVCGYDWITEDAWSATRDAQFFADMIDTCLPFEAWRAQPNRCPTGYFGRNATLRVYGDSLVRLQNVTRVAKDGQWYRAVTSNGVQTFMSAVVAGLRRQTDSEHSEQAVTVVLEVWAPLNQTGQFNTAVDSLATVFWGDVASGRTYWARRNYVGVGCQINITKSTPEFIQGTFSGKVGYWDVTQNPESVPPIQTLHLTDGVFKVTMIDTTQSPGSRRTAASLTGR